jgi:hypothetical protein
MPDLDVRPARICIALALWCVLLSAGEPASPAGKSFVRLSENDTVALGADDTLELALKLPAGVPSEATPQLHVWLLKNSEQAPQENNPGAGCVFAWKSPRVGEWLVHVRGLKAPQAGSGKWDLLLRWKVQ